MQRALITGITGQDGSYLTELLLEKGYEVHGLIRRASTFNTSRIDHLFKDPHELNNNLHLHYVDIPVSSGITNLLWEIEPHEVYNLAAQSHVMVSFTMPTYTAQVDAVGTIALLEAIRSSKLQKNFIKQVQVNCLVPPHLHKMNQVSFNPGVRMPLQNSMRIG